MLKNKKGSSEQPKPWIDGAKASLNDTVVIYYQGMGATQAEAADYTGQQRIQTTTGEIIFSHKGINIIPPQCLSLYPEIAEVDRQKPLSSHEKEVRQMTLWKQGINLDKSGGPLNYATLQTEREAGQLLTSEVDFSKSSLGQTTDTLAHKKKYDHAVNHIKRNHIILHAPSRGGATTFRAIAEHQYERVDACILEAPPSSLHSLAKTRVSQDYALPRSLGSYLYRSGWIARQLFGGQHQSGKEHQAIAYADRFPHHVPLVIVSSTADDIVPHQDSMKLALRVAANRIAAQQADHTQDIAPVYFLQLDNTNHCSYGVDASEDGRRYQNFVHAVYRTLGLPHIEDYANLGQDDLMVAELTKGPLKDQVMHQASFKVQKDSRAMIREAALKALTEETLPNFNETYHDRLLGLCYHMPLYAKNLEPTYCTPTQTEAQTALEILRHPPKSTLGS